MAKNLSAFLILLTLVGGAVAEVANTEGSAKVTTATKRLNKLRLEAKQADDRWKGASNGLITLNKEAQVLWQKLQESSVPEGIKAGLKGRITSKIKASEKAADKLKGELDGLNRELSEAPLNARATVENLDVVERTLSSAETKLKGQQEESVRIDVDYQNIKKGFKEAAELIKRFPPGNQGKAKSVEHTKDEFLKRLLAVGTTLDYINAGLREFGSITLSAPLFSSPDTNLFAFNYAYGTSNYVADAKSHRDFEMAYFDQVMSAFAAKIAVDVNPDVMKQYQRDLSDYLNGRERLQQGQSLVDGTMRTNFMAEVERAVQETNAVTRTTILTNALNSYRGYLTNSTLGSSTHPSITNYAAPSGSNGLPEQLDLSKYLETAKMKGPLGLLTNSNKTAIPNRTALITAAGDQVVEGIFKLLGDPAKTAQFKDKITLFSAVTVGVDPGWRTAKDYAADVLMQTEFLYQEARPEVVRGFVTSSQFPLRWRARLLVDAEMDMVTDDIGFDGIRGVEPSARIPAWLDHQQHLIDAERGKAKAAPIVYAVSPLTETVVMNQEASLRSQRQLALSLAALFQGAGYQAQGAAMFQYAQQLQTDVRGVSASAAMNAYSAGGGISGFQVGPRFKAIADPARKKKEPGFVFERQSFPALFILGFDRADIQPMLAWTTNASGNVRLVLMEPTFHFTQTARWLPLTNPNCDTTLSSRMTERWRLEMSYKAAEARVAALDAADALKQFPGANRAAWLAKDQLNLVGPRNDPIRYLAMGNYSDQSVPIELMLPEKPKPVEPVKTPVINGIEPNVIHLPEPGSNQPPQNVYVLVKGQNLSGKDTTVDTQFSPGVTAEIIGRAKEGLTVKIAVAAPKTIQALLQFTLSKGDTKLPDDVKAFAPPVAINFPKPKEGSASSDTNPPPMIHVSYESQGTNGTAKSEDVKISGDITMDQLKELQKLNLGRPPVQVPDSVPTPKKDGVPPVVPTQGGGKSTSPVPVKGADSPSTSPMQAPLKK